MGRYILKVRGGEKVRNVSNRPLSNANIPRNILTRHAGSASHECAKWTNLLQDVRPQIQIPQIACDVLAWAGSVVLMDGLHRCW